MKKILRFTIVLSLLAIIVVMTTSVGAESGNPEGESPEARLAEVYAKRFGVTVDEALNRLHLQNAFPDLEPALGNNEADTFAGLWIQHEPEYKIVVAFTRDGERTITKYSDYIPGNVAPHIEVRTVGKSLAALLNDQQQMTLSLKEQAIKTDSWADVRSNLLIVDISANDKVAYDGAVDAGTIAPPNRLKVNVVGELATPVTDVYGGLTLDDWVWGGAHATSGFSVRDSSGTEGIITAAHANNGLWYAGNNLPFQDEEYGTSYDVQWHTSTGLTETK